MSINKTKSVLVPGELYKFKKSVTYKTTINEIVLTTHGYSLHSHSLINIKKTTNNIFMFLYNSSKLIEMCDFYFLKESHDINKNVFWANYKRYIIYNCDTNLIKLK